MMDAALEQDAVAAEQVRDARLFFFPSLDGKKV